jgi:hypothetical protein
MYFKASVPGPLLRLQGWNPGVGEVRYAIGPEVTEPASAVAPRGFPRCPQPAVAHRLPPDGEVVIVNGGPMEATPGRVVRGPGWTGWTE